MNKRLKIVFNSPVVLGFAAICAVVMIVSSFTAGASTRMFFMTYHSPLTSILTYVRMFTHVLGHADWSHYLSNMIWILLLGPMLEEKYSGRNLVKVMIITALVTGLFNYIVFPTVALCGASGICFAFIIMASFTNFKEREIPLTFIIVAVIFIGQQIYQGMAFDDNIANVAHIIGGIVGASFGFIFNRK